MVKFVWNGVPNGSYVYNSEGEMAVKTDDMLNRSLPTIITGDVTNQIILTPTSGRRLLIRAISIIAQGNTGTVKVKRSSDGAIILPTYVSAHNHASTSSALNLILGVDESVMVTTDGRGETDETFVGLSYMVI